MTRAIAQKIKTMYGPKGLNKMIIPFSNQSILTQKGYQVVKAFKSRIPITLMLINLVQSQEDRCGDSTKTALLLTAFLLEKAREMINQGISPQTINQGYSLALNKALEILENNIIGLNQNSEKRVKQIISSVMNNKLTMDSKDIFVKLIFQAIKLFSSISKNDFDFSNITFRRIQGESLNDSEVINGVIIYKNKPQFSLSNHILNPKILLVKKSLDFFIANNKEPYKKDVNINSVEKLKEFSSFRNNFYSNMARDLKQVGIDVLLCRKKINPSLVEYCTNLGITALELVGDEDLKKLSKMLDVPVISSFNSIISNDIGIADKVEFRKISNDEMFIIKKQNSPFFSFIIKGATPEILDELEEILSTSLRIAIDTLKDGKLLPGAGALECEINKQLKDYAKEFSNKYQYVIREYGRAFENFPAHLILNSGADPFDLIPQLRKAHSEGNSHSGFDCNNNVIIDVVESKIFDGYNSKKHAIKIASEMARQIIRIDDSIVVYDRKLHEKLEKESQAVKDIKNQERIRNYFKKNENKLLSQ